MPNALTTTQPIGQGFTLTTSNAGPIQFVVDVGAAGGVISVFGRTGVVVAQNGDYTSGQVTNTSGVAGATVSNALDALQTQITNLTSSQVSNVSSIAGATVTAALNTLGTAITALAAATVPNTRTINATSPIRIDGGTAADLSADRTLSVLSVTNSNNGVAVAHAGAPDVGKALIATATAAAWGTNFGAQPLVTTASLSLDSSPATVGSLRGGSAFRAVVWSGAVNKDWFTYDQPGNTFVINSEANNGANRATTVSVNFASGGSFSALQAGVAQLVISNGVSVFSTTAVQFAATVVAPRWTQTAGVNGTGQSMTMQAMSMAGTGGAVGGTLGIAAGDATGVSGSRVGGAFTARVGQGANADGTMTLTGGPGANGLMLQAKEATNTTQVQLLNWDSSASGQLQLGSSALATIRLVAATALAVTVPAAATATAGAGTLPVTPQEFMPVTFNGNARKIPLYLT